MSKDDVLNKMRTEIKQEQVGYPPSADYRKAIMKCLQIIDKYKPELEKLPKWIPVTEAPPKEGATVIASGKYNVYPEARFTKDYGWEWAYEAGTGYWTSIIEPVKAWMPLLVLLLMP